ncbi:hypothetical protein JHK86_018916 [Glycine max]|nr:hypothetical protein JHK86_018916 [Glycine max]
MGVPAVECWPKSPLHHRDSLRRRKRTLSHLRHLCVACCSNHRKLVDVFVFFYGVEEAWKKELKEAMIIEMSQKGSQVSASTHVDINVLGARVSTKESNAEIGVNPSREEQLCDALKTTDDNKVPQTTPQLEYDNGQMQERFSFLFLYKLEGTF